MNILDILIVVVLGFSVFSGMHKGFLSSLLMTVALIGSWFGARQVYARLAEFALSNDTLMGALTQYLEPEQFFDAGIGNTLVSSLSGQADQIKALGAKIGEQIPVLQGAFEANLQSQAFSALDIKTVAEYFDQTLWQSLFSVGAFIVAFALFFLLSALVVNLLDHVIRFPVIRGFDSILGGVLGLVRGVVIVMLLLAVAIPIGQAAAAEFVQPLLDGSMLYSTVVGFDFIGAFKQVTALIR